MHRHDASSWCIIMMHHHDSSWWCIITMHHYDAIIMMHHHDASWRCIIMMHHHDASARCIIMMQHDDASLMHHHDASWWCITMMHHDDAPQYRLASWRKEQNVFLPVEVDLGKQKMHFAYRGWFSKNLPCCFKCIFLLIVHFARVVARISNFPIDQRAGTIPRYVQKNVKQMSRGVLEMSKKCLDMSVDICLTFVKG